VMLPELELIGGPHDGLHIPVRHVPPQLRVPLLSAAYLDTIVTNAPGFPINFPTQHFAVYERSADHHFKYNFSHYDE
jgi:hypothetical protein